MNLEKLNARNAEYDRVYENPKLHVIARARKTLQAISAVTSFSLRVAVFYFVRWLPLGSRFLPIIYGNFAASMGSALLSWLLVPKRSRTTPRRPRLVTVLSGWVDARDRGASAISVGINVLCLLFALDFVYRNQILNTGQNATFTRVGFVSTASASIVLRSPGISAAEVSWRPENGSWTTPLVVVLSEANDFVATVQIPRLQPDMLYEYQTNISGTIAAGRAASGSFKTRPGQSKKFSIATSSGLTPGFPYNPFASSLRMIGLERLSTYISSLPIPIDFFLFLGDFIDMDLPTRVASTNGEHRQAYRRIYSSPSWTQTLRDTPFVHTYNNQEIPINWSANKTAPYAEAMEPYLTYQYNANPNVQGERSYFTTDRADVSFFVMDTRRYRSSPNVEDGPEKTMLGVQQKKEFELWLASGKKWKVVVSSVPFTRNSHGVEDADSWASYLWERQRLLEKMWKVGGVIVLSGGSNAHVTTEFPSPDGKSSVVEFATSGLSQFYQPSVRSYNQAAAATDVEIYSYSQGGSKFGVLTFDTSEKKIWRLEFKLIVDGRETWTKRVRSHRKRGNVLEH